MIELLKLRETLLRLRTDAVERGMMELAIAYGWSAIQLGSEILKSQIETQSKGE